MGIFLLFLIVLLFISIASAWFIAKAAYKKLQSQNNQYDQVFAALIFLFSLVIIGGGIFFLVATNIPFGR